MTQIVYDLYLDATNDHVERLTVTTLCASNPANGTPMPPLEEALSTRSHIAFVADYRFRREEVEAFEVPAAAQKAMR